MSFNFLSLKPGEFSILVNPAFMRNTPACTATACDVTLNTRNHYTVFLGKKGGLKPDVILATFISFILLTFLAFTD